MPILHYHLKLFVMSLKNKICLVTGASRGIGRGIALALGSEGATVYITGRTLEPSSTAPGSLVVTADEISARGGVAVPVQCDHAVDEEVHRLFDRIKSDFGHIDLLVNNAFKGVTTIGKNINTPFWEQSIDSWDDVMNVGLRCHFVASQCASKLMVEQRSGLIVNISSAGALFDFFTVPYGVGKSGLDKMSAMFGLELKKHNVAALSLWPGLVKTEYMIAAKDSIKGNTKMKMDVDKGESVEYTGRVIVALMNDAKLMEKSGKTIVVADLASEYSIKDVDGTSHNSLRCLSTAVGMKYPTLANFIPGFIKIPWSVLVALVHRFY